MFSNIKNSYIDYTTYLIDIAVKTQININQLAQMDIRYYNNIQVWHLKINREKGVNQGSTVYIVKCKQLI